MILSGIVVPRDAPQKISEEKHKGRTKVKGDEKRVCGLEK